MLGQGQWNGGTIVKSIAPLVTPSQSLDVRYGLLWWLNTSAPDQPALAPAAPANMFSAEGALGRELFVLPDQQVTVVRLGDRPGNAFATRLWAMLADAMHLASR